MVSALLIKHLAEKLDSLFSIYAGNDAIYIHFYFLVAETLLVINNDVLKAQKVDRKTHLEHS